MRKHWGEMKYKKNAWTRSHVKDSNLENTGDSSFHSEFSLMNMLKVNIIKEKYHSFQEDIYPVIALAQFFGLMPVNGISSKNPKDLKFEYKTFKYVYSLINIAAISTLIAFTVAWMIVKRIGFGIGGPFVWYTINFFATICFYDLAKKWPKLMVQWDSIERELPCLRVESEPKKLNAEIKLITFVLMIVALVEHIFSIASQVYKAFSCACFYNKFEWFYTRSYAPFSQFVSFSLPTTLLMLVVNLFCTFTWNFTDLFIIAISAGLSTHMKQINNNMKIVKGQVVPEIFWEIHRNCYQNFCGLLESIDEALAWLILISLSSNLYSLCTQLLNIIKPFDNLVHATYFWFSLTFLIARTFAVTAYAANIHDQSRKPVDILHNVPSSCYNVEVIRFFQQLIFNKVALTGHKFFYITRHLILKIAVTVVTYEIVLVQYSVGDINNLEKVDKCA